MTEETIFVEALARKDPARRSTFLDEACRGDAALRERVEALLRSHEDAGSFLEHPAVQPGTDGAAETWTAPRVGGADGATIDFLLPSDQPGHLGRLGNFEVLEVVGRGGMGVVFKALDESLRRVVAVKAMAPELAANQAARRRFQREGYAAAAVTHDNVVTIHGVQEANGLPCIVMQYVAGESLQQRLDRTGPLELKEILRIGMQTAAGLAAAHAQGLIHRDIKPANILLENGVARVKITDFGLARAVDDASVTQSGVIAGTPMFMSPEQAAGEPADHRADLFSLGSVMYAMCTGHPPFRATGTMGVLKRVIDDTPRPIREVNPDIPDWLSAIIARLHAKKPAERFQSAKEVAELLGQHLAHLQRPDAAPMPAPVLAPASKPRLRRTRWRRVAALTAVALALIFGVTWFGTPAPLYLANEGLLTLNDSNPEFKEFWVKSNLGRATVSIGRNMVTTGGQRWKVKTRTSLRLPPGQYEVEAVSRNGEQPTRWLVGSSGWFSGLAAAQESRFAKVEIKRGERVNVSVAKWEPRPKRVSPEPDAQKLQGTWEWTRYEAEGEKLVVRGVEIIRFTFDGSELRQQWTRPRGQRVPLDKSDIQGTFQLDETKSPKRITVFSPSDNANSMVGIYKLDGDRLTLCYRADPKGLDYPTEFATKPGDGLQLVEFKRSGPASRPGDLVRPFTVFLSGGGGVKSYPTLGEAIGHANSGATIEIKGDGPFTILPFVLGEKALTIRAQAGSRPVFVRDFREKPSAALFHTHAPLVLEGLEIIQAGNDPGYTPTIVKTTAAFAAANCCFRSPTGGCIETWRKADVELRNCQLHCLGVAVWCWEPAGNRVSIDNCILTGDTALSFGLSPPDSGKVVPPLCAVELVQNTVRAWTALNIQFDGAKIAIPAAKDGPSLIPIRADGNAFDVDFMLRSAGEAKALPSRADATDRTKGYEFYAYFGRVLGWKGTRNAFRGYDGRPFELAFAEGPIRWTNWETRWGPNEADSVAGEFYYMGGDWPVRVDGSDLQPKLTTKLKNNPEHVVPADFRPRSGSASHEAHDGRVRGADVDLVGPGAYETWRKSAAYRGWRKRVDQAR